MEGIVDHVLITRLDDEEIKKISEVEVKLPYGGCVDKTIYDNSMGVCENTKKCLVCTNNNIYCTGGYGFINMSVPYYLPSFGKIICNILTNICTTCFEPGPIKKSLLNKSSVKDTFGQILYNCLTCTKGKYVTIIERKNNNDHYWETEFFDTLSKTVICITTIKKWVDECIMKRRCRFTKNILITNNFIVIPPCVRPYFPKNNQAYQNDTSTIYNSLLKIKKEDKRLVQKECYSKIEMLLTQKKKKPLPNSSKIPQSLQDRLQKKNGLITSGINGRRVNHSSRATITGYPSGRLGYVGIPAKMASKNTIPILLFSVGDYRIDDGIVKIKDFILKYNVKVLRIYNKQTGKIYRPLVTSIERVLKHLGDVDPQYLWIDKPLEDGDIVLFNRQPSLRPESIIAMRVKIINDCNTLRLVLPCTPPLNADFDGDESNLHIIQDIAAAVECILLMSPGEMIISSQKGTPLITPVQDAILGTYLLSMQKYISSEFLMDMTMIIDMSIDQYEKKIESWKKINNQSINIGNFCISLLFDESFYYELNDEFCIEGGIINIEKSPKYLDKTILCSGIKSILHFYYYDIGKSKTCSFIDNIQYMTNFFLSKYGFTIGLDDCRPDKIKLDSKINPDTILTEQSPKFSDNSNLEMMIQSGAKATLTNATQIKRLIGQQSLDGGLIENEMRTGRTMVYFDRNDIVDKESTLIDLNTSISKGFIVESFAEGLKKSSNMFHCKAGRRGVGDSVTKVADIGYTFKKLSKTLENYLIAHDKTIRDISSNNIISFLFGVDGMNIQMLPSENIHNKFKKCYLNKHDFNKIKCFTRESFIQSMQNVVLGLNKPNLIMDNLKDKIIKSIPLHYFNEDKKHLENNISDITLKLNGILLSRMMEPGAPVGLITSTNFGEIMSQLLLKSFHHSGIKSRNINSGIIRMNQLMNRTNKSKEYTIYGYTNDEIYNMLRNAYTHALSNKIKTILKLSMEDRCNFLLNSVRSIKLKNIISYSAIECVAGHSIFLCNCDNKTIRFVYVLDENKLGEFGGYKLISSEKHNWYKIEDTIYIDTTETDIKQLILQNNIFLDLELNDNFIQELDRCKLVFNSELSHIEFSFRNSKISNVLNIPFIDKKSITSDDIFVVYEAFGVEAARQVLYSEILAVLVFDGADIDRRYIHFICDALTHTGKITSINNYSSILTNALYEREIKKFTNYSLVDAVDNCKSVESSVFLGTPAKLGTMFFDLLKT